jgi:hypothetical protein
MWPTVHHDGAVIHDALEQLVRLVRRVSRSQKFKYHESNFTRNERAGLQSCCQYIATGFSEHSKLLFLRVDLYFLPDHKGWANTLQAQLCVKRFLRALRESRVVPDVKRWICKRENAFRRGIHLHLMVALDGHKHRDAANLSQKIGEAWVRQYSGGKGSYFNCYGRKDEYKFNGLGLVHVSDREKLLGVREAIKYMTKGSCQVTTGYARNLWRGIMRVPSNQLKLGAPRKAENVICAVKEILGFE